ncbi:hypothetical protein [Pseudomonas rhodesiae]|uniref:hypothetical protein n=1 Tax=Pseudomonas rhodesiae TaxID=76760 RepID=UPI00117A8480|nr:hypothetical protein [Pseudomonas rhodesiae]
MTSGGGFSCSEIVKQAHIHTIKLLDVLSGAVLQMTAKKSLLFPLMAAVFMWPPLKMPTSSWSACKFYIPRFYFIFKKNPASFEAGFLLCRQTA